MRQQRNLVSKPLSNELGEDTQATLHSGDGEFDNNNNNNYNKLASALWSAL